jgi:hypothetical protein
MRLMESAAQREDMQSVDTAVVAALNRLEIKNKSHKYVHCTISN